MKTLVKVGSRDLCETVKVTAFSLKNSQGTCLILKSKAAALKGRRRLFQYIKKYMFAPIDKAFDITVSSLDIESGEGEGRGARVGIVREPGKIPTTYLAGGLENLPRFDCLF